MPLIACLTEKGRLVIFAHDEIRRLSNGGMGVSLVKLESGERMIGMTLVDERGLTASGTGRGGKPERCRSPASPLRSSACNAPARPPDRRHLDGRVDRPYHARQA